MKFDTNRIREVLSNRSADWQVREQAMSLLSQKIKHRDLLALSFLEEFGGPCLASQFGDLRSGTVKAASEVILAISSSFFADNCSKVFEFSEQLLAQSELISALGSANVTISKFTDQAISSLFESGFVSFQALERMLNVATCSKSGKFKSKVANFFSIFVKKVSEGSQLSFGRKNEILSEQKIINFFEEGASKLIGDASGEVRSYARRIFLYLGKIKEGVAKGTGFSRAKSQDIKSSSKIIQEEQIKSTQNVVSRPKTKPRSSSSSNIPVIDLKNQPYFSEYTTIKQKEKSIGKSSCQRLKSNGKKKSTKSINDFENGNYPKSLANLSKTETTKETKIEDSEYLNENLEISENLIAILDDCSVPVSTCVKVLSKINPEQINSKRHLLTLSNLLLNSPSPDIRREAMRLLDTCDLWLIGQDVLNFLCKIKATKSLALNFLVVRALKIFPLIAFCSLFTSSKRYSPLILLGKKLSDTELDSFFDSSNRMLCLSVIEKLISIASNPEGKVQLRSIAAECLISLSKHEKFISVAILFSNFTSACKFAQESGIRNSHNLSFSNLKNEPNFLEAQLKSSSSQTRKRVLLGIIEHLSKMSTDSVEENTFKVFQKSVQTISIISQLDIMTEEIIASIFLSISLIMSKCPCEEIKRSLFQIILRLEKNVPKDLGGLFFELIVELDRMDQIFGFLIENLSNFQEVSSYLGFIKRLFRFASKSEQKSCIESSLKRSAEDLLNLFRTKLFNHKEVMVRKQVVEVMVKIYLVYPPEESEPLFSKFSKEQMKVLQVFLKKDPNFT